MSGAGGDAAQGWVRRVCVTAVVAGAASAEARAQAPPPVLAGARQLVLVTSAGWGDTTATLRRYARGAAGGPWRPVGGPVPVVLGRAGLAWGAGQGSIPARGAVPKREGDGRSPAGAFGLLHTFGYGAEPPAAAAPNAGAGRLPHVAVAPGTVCVDDPASALYNVVADSAAASSARWASAERMREVAGYRTGVVVAYNGARTRAAGVRLASPGGVAVPGRGSCIFLHVWDGPGRPTAGCTAMAAPDAATLAAWLDPRARPALVQLPAAAVARLRGAWGLPADAPPRR